MGLFYYKYGIFKDIHEAALDALDDAKKKVAEGKLYYATLGGPMLFKYSDQGKEIESKGITIIQVTGCEIWEYENMWCDIFNAYFGNLLATDPNKRDLFMLYHKIVYNNIL